MLVDHAASAALACDSDETLAIRAGRIDCMIGKRTGRIADS
jgi:hypothetical protein